MHLLACSFVGLTALASCLQSPSAVPSGGQELESSDTNDYPREEAFDVEQDQLIAERKIEIPRERDDGVEVVKMIANPIVQEQESFADSTEASGVAKLQESSKLLQRLLLRLSTLIPSPSHATPSRLISSSRLYTTTRMNDEAYSTSGFYDAAPPAPPPSTVAVGSSDSSSVPPTEKQLAYAQRLSQQLGKPLTELARKDMSSCSDFIDECLSQTPPSERQLAFAQKISRDARIDLPQQAMQSSKAIGDYIEANKHLLRSGGDGKGGMGETYSIASSRAPTEKQLLFAVKLAQERKLGLTAEQLQSQSEISQFIESCISGTSRPSRVAQNNDEAAYSLIPEFQGDNEGVDADDEDDDDDEEEIDEDDDEEYGEDDDPVAKVGDEFGEDDDPEVMVWGWNGKDLDAMIGRWKERPGPVWA